MWFHVKVNKLPSLLVLMCGFMVSACHATVQENVKEQWTDTIKLYALIPVYPMRENVYIGDLRVTGNASDDKSLNYRNFGRVSVETVLREEIEAMPELSRTTSERSELDGRVVHNFYAGKRDLFKSYLAKNIIASLTKINDITNDATNIDDIHNNVTKIEGIIKKLAELDEITRYLDDGDDITAPREHANRMNIVALPSIEYASVDSTKLSALLPSPKASIFANLGFEVEDQVSIKLDGIASIELSDKAAWKLLKKACEDNTSGKSGTSNLPDSALLASLKHVSKQDDSENKMEGVLSLINRVFYARAISYTQKVRSEKILEGGYKEKMKEKGEGNESMPDNNSKGNKPRDAGENAEKGEGLDITPTIETLDLKTPGVSASIFSISRAKISLIQTFKRPLAFGVDVMSVGISSGKNGDMSCSLTSDKPPEAFLQ